MWPWASCLKSETEPCLIIAPFENINLTHIGTSCRCRRLKNYTWRPRARLSKYGSLWCTSYYTSYVIPVTWHGASVFHGLFRRTAPPPHLCQDRSTGDILLCFPTGREWLGTINIFKTLVERSTSGWTPFFAALIYCVLDYYIIEWCDLQALFFFTI